MNMANQIYFLYDMRFRLDMHIVNSHFLDKHTYFVPNYQFFTLHFDKNENS